MPIIANQWHGKVQVRVAGGTPETITLANTEVTPSIPDAQYPPETVTGLHISKVYWCGNTTIARGANNILTLTGEGDWILDGDGFALTEFPAANVVITVAAGGTALVELQKVW